MLKMLTASSHDRFTAAMRIFGFGSKPLFSAGQPFGWSAPPTTVLPGQHVLRFRLGEELG